VRDLNHGYNGVNKAISVQITQAKAGRKFADRITLVLAKSATLLPHHY